MLFLHLISLSQAWLESSVILLKCRKKKGEAKVNLAFFFFSSGGMEVFTEMN